TRRGPRTRCGVPRGERVGSPRRARRAGARPGGRAALPGAAHRAEGGRDRRRRPGGDAPRGRGRVRGEPPTGSRWRRPGGCAGTGDRDGSRTRGRTENGDVMSMREPRVLVISDGDPGLPYSKGTRASELMVTGLSSFRSYQIAE